MGGISRTGGCIMAIRKATGIWQGDLKGGSGTVAVESGLFEGAYTFASRFEEAQGTNPDELVGAALASCFSMFLASKLAGAGFTPTRVHTEAKVHLGKDDVGPAITRIELVCRAEVPGVETATFDELAKASKEGCPVSKALASVPIELDASLE
jgi:lipoyl-dependent peroxiredoxin